jgi:hypothetical protein
MVVEGKSTFALASAIFASQLSTSYNILSEGGKQTFSQVRKSANSWAYSAIANLQMESPETAKQTNFFFRLGTPCVVSSAGFSVCYAKLNKIPRF